MDIVLEFFLELIVDGGIEASGNKKLSRWIRYPLIALVVLFFWGCDCHDVLFGIWSEF